MLDLRRTPAFRGDERGSGCLVVRRKPVIVVIPLVYARLALVDEPCADDTVQKRLLVEQLNRSLGGSGTQEGYAARAPDATVLMV